MTRHPRAHITDHALVRYMERVLGMDMEGYRAIMDKPGLKTSVEAGVNRVTIDGVEFFCKNGRVVTLWNSGRDGKSNLRIGGKAKTRTMNQKRKGGGSHRRRKGLKGS